MKMNAKAFIAGSALVLALAGCSGQAEQTSTQASTAESTVAQTESVQPETTATETQSTEAPQPAATPSVQWTQAGNAEEAAQNAGVERFGVMGTINLDGTEFTNPAFAYASGITQATYTAGDVTLVVRKANDANAASISDRAEADFPEKWNKNYEDLDITMWGPAKGAATVITWKDGGFTYGVTYQTTSDTNTLDTDEVAVLVKAIKEANIVPPADAPQPAQPAQPGEEAPAEDVKPATTDTEAPADSGYITNAEAKSKVAEQSGQEADEVYAEYVDGHYFVTEWVDGVEVTYEVDAETGEVWEHTFTRNADGSTTFTTMTEDGAVEVVENNAEGSVVTSSTPVYNDEYGQTWLVTSTDSNGNYYAYYVDGNGNMYDADFNY